MVSYWYFFLYVLNLNWLLNCILSILTKALYFTASYFSFFANTPAIFNLHYFCKGQRGWSEVCNLSSYTDFDFFTGSTRVVKPINSQLGQRSMHQRARCLDLTDRISSLSRNCHWGHILACLYLAHIFIYLLVHPFIDNLSAIKLFFVWIISYKFVHAHSNWSRFIQTCSNSSSMCGLV